METICGRFVLDFLIESPSLGKTAFECDGKEFHNKSRDEWRDAMILGATNINTIYRLRGSDLTYHINDVLYVIANYTPDIFSGRGVLNLKQLASKEILHRTFNLYDTIDLISFPENEAGDMSRIYIERHHKNIPDGKTQFWQTLYEFAVAEEGGNLDEIINKYRSTTFNKSIQLDAE